MLAANGGKLPADLKIRSINMEPYAFEGKISAVSVQVK